MDSIKKDDGDIAKFCCWKIIYKKKNWTYKNSINEKMNNFSEKLRKNCDVDVGEDITPKINQ